MNVVGVVEAFGNVVVLGWRHGLGEGVEQFSNPAAAETEAFSLAGAQRAPRGAEIREVARDDSCRTVPFCRLVETSLRALDNSDLEGLPQKRQLLC